MTGLFIPLMPSTLLLIPTYNEANNVLPLVEQIQELDLELDLLFIDDASTDETVDQLHHLTKEHDFINVLHRPEKLGLGSAYRDGFQHSLNTGYTFTMCMDADLSHDPADLIRFLKALEKQDVVCGSRYLAEGGIKNWSLHRRFLSKSAAIYTRFLTRIPVTDPTGGFNAYRNEMLHALPLSDMTSNGYSFQIEMKHLAWKKGYRIQEIPIIFTERRAGTSKMNPGIIKEALWVVWKLVLGR